MSARLYRLGTIYSRIHGLIRKGHMKEFDKPIWFDVYQNFPPKYTPTFKRKMPETQLKVIFYEEDLLRAKIHKAFGNKVGLIDLNGNKLLFCESLLKTCQQYIAEGLSENEAIEKLKNSIKDSVNLVATQGKTVEDDISDAQKTLSEIF